MELKGCDASNFSKAAVQVKHLCLCGMQMPGRHSKAK